MLTYVNAISSGDLPCMENAVLAWAQVENSASMQKGIAHSDQKMGSINASIKPAISPLKFTSKEKVRIRRKDNVLLMCLLS